MEVFIEKLIYGGEGLARLPADERGPGKALFVPFVLAGERVDATIKEQRPGFARATLDNVITPSPCRVEPSCPYFARCGGCHYQHTGYEHQLEIKKAILRETLLRTAKLVSPPDIQVHPSPPWNYRNRTRMRIVRANGNFTIGYNRFASSDVLAVETCPISSPLINHCLAAIWELGRAGRLPPAVVELEFFANGHDTELLLELTVPRKAEIRQLVAFVSELRSNMPAVVAVALFSQERNRALVRWDIPEDLRETFGADHLRYSTGLGHYQVSAGSFFQTNRFLTDTLVELTTGFGSGDYALDLYAGTGLFTVPLSRNFQQVAAVESAPSSAHDLKQNCPSNVVVHPVSTEEFLSHVSEDTRVDALIVDPPRAGLGAKVAYALGQLKAPRLTYVSCDPSTLARDLVVLMQAGYRIQQAHLIDLFPQTFHIETIFHLAA
ncbi:MAG: 23S rRNA (uracil(1939)-C(5))-methyltransferase RlmD [Acidobacteriaceae bacterium]|nr:23S rRNA (uracil(1939)-C(5))-methyltransferase RlmD [Acidobacteriaceae bacterium]